MFGPANWLYCDTIMSSKGALVPHALPTLTFCMFIHNCTFMKPFFSPNSRKHARHGRRSRRELNRRIRSGLTSSGICGNRRWSSRLRRQKRPAADARLCPTPRKSSVSSAMNTSGMRSVCLILYCASLWLRWGIIMYTCSSRGMAITSGRKVLWY